MKKLIYMMLFVFGMNATNQIFAQCGEIQSINSPQDPCDGTYDVHLTLNRTGQPGTFVWSRMSGEPLPPIFITYPNGDRHLYGQIFTDMTDTYICTFKGINSGTKIVVVEVSVHPKPKWRSPRL